MAVGITPEQFEQMQKRLRTPAPATPSSRLARTASPILPQTAEPTKPQHKVILGVDPSLRGTGYGVIELAKPVPRTLAEGTISCPAGWERSRCLVKISQTLREVLQKYRPTACAIEGLFFAQNLQTALIMGEARGAALCTIAEANVEIFEISPRKMKQAIVGYGAAQKIAVAKMVQRMLQLPQPPAPDAADALALALAFAQGNSQFSLSSPKRV